MTAAKLGNAMGLNPKDAQNQSGNPLHDFANSMIGSVVSVHTRRAFGFDDPIHYGSMAADAFGNALGNAIVGGIKTRAAEKQAKLDQALAANPFSIERAGRGIAGMASTAYGAETFGLGPDAMPATVMPLPASFDRAGVMASLNRLFDQPLDPNISNAELRAMAVEYGPALNGGGPATTLAAVQVNGRSQQAADNLSQGIGWGVYSPATIARIATAYTSTNQRGGRVPSGLAHAAGHPSPQLLDNTFWGQVGQAEAGTGVLLGSLQRGYANVGWNNFRWLGNAPRVPIELMFDASGRYHPWLAVDAMPGVDKLQFGPNIRYAEKLLDFTDAANSVAHKTAFVGPVISLIEAVNTEMNSNADGGDRFRDWGKFTVDAGITVVGFALSKGSAIGWAYTAADFGVSFVEYTPRFGQEAGNVKTSWTAMGYMASDAWQNHAKNSEQMLRQNPQMWREIYGRRW